MFLQLKFWFKRMCIRPQCHLRLSGTSGHCNLRLDMLLPVCKVHAQMLTPGVQVTMHSDAIHHALQVNLFIAVLKIKFAKAQTLFHSRLAKMSKKKRKNILGRVMEKGKKRIKDQVKKQREAGEVSSDCHKRHCSR